MWSPCTHFIQDTIYTELWTLLSINNTLPIHVWHATDMADKRRVDITLIDRYYTLLYTNYELHFTTPYWSKRLKRPLLIKGLFLKVLALPDVTHSPKSLCLPPSGYDIVHEAYIKGLTKSSWLLPHSPNSTKLKYDENII